MTVGELELHEETGKDVACYGGLALAADGVAGGAMVAARRRYR
jgi:hypothetical protein